MERVPFEFYATEYKGKLPQDSYEQMYCLAEGTLQGITNGRAALVEGPRDKRAVCMALCALTDLHYRQAQDGGRHIIQEAVGRHSVRYAESKNAVGGRARDVVRPYLYGVHALGVPLLYRGASCMDWQEKRD